MADLLSSITSWAKRRGFFYQSADLYGGINGIYDKGPLGVLLEEKIFNFWRYHTQQAPFDFLPFDGAVIGSEALWRASGHIEHFHDPLVDCKHCKMRFRADDISLDNPCPRCGVKQWSEVRQFNMMFSTKVGATTVGATTEEDALSYLRPETAQSIFVQSKNIFSSNRIKIPCGIFQKGLAFRNEITPKQFIFRTRAFTQIELEFFCHPTEAETHFSFWQQQRLLFYEKLGLSSVRLRAHQQDELAHYAKATSDIEYSFPFGWKELEGIAYRGSWDLGNHQTCAKKNLSVSAADGTSYIPEIVECSVGVERLMLALFCNGYDEEKREDETRVVFRIVPFLAPISVAIFPLTSLEIPLARKIKEQLSPFVSCVYDDSGSIGKRYRRQDEIGTPLCITVDETSRHEGTVTVRERDSMAQQRISQTELTSYCTVYTAYPSFSSNS